MAQLQIVGVTKNSISARVIELSTSFAYTRRFEWKLNDILKGINYSSAGASVSPTFIYSDLNSNTIYSVSVDIYNDSSGAFLASFLLYVTTSAGISPWEWYTPKATNEDMLNPVTRSEWLAFCNKINEIRLANGLLIYPFTTSITYIDTDKPFAAWIFLQAANAISDLGGVAPQVLAVKSMSEDKWGTSSIIYPWYFTNLRAALNNAIP